MIHWIFVALAMIPLGVIVHYHVRCWQVTEDQKRWIEEHRKEQEESRKRMEQYWKEVDDV